MKTYFTADTHFGHARIIELAHRPFADVEEMNRELLERINSTVSSEDRLVILGDICMGKLEESLPLLAEIRAKELILVPGNHDRWSLAYHHRGEDVAAKRHEFRLRYEAQRARTIAFQDAAPSGWSLFGLTGDWETLATPLGAAWFSHYPYEGDSQGEDRAAFLRVEDDGVSPIIHGHVHEEWQIRGRQFNVGVDVNEFAPVSEEKLNDWVSSLEVPVEA
jgi:calcineurin-like phosphoesterase family protein